jgi:hypothetical protein
MAFTKIVYRIANKWHGCVRADGGFVIIRAYET